MRSNGEGWEIVTPGLLKNSNMRRPLYAAGQGLVAWLLLKCMEQGVTVLMESPATQAPAGGRPDCWC